MFSDACGRPSSGTTRTSWTCSMSITTYPGAWNTCMLLLYDRGNMALGIPPRRDAALPDVPVRPGIVAARAACPRQLPGRRQRRKPAIRRVHDHRRPIRPRPAVHPEVVVGAYIAARPGSLGLRAQELLVAGGSGAANFRDLFLGQRLSALELLRPLHRRGPGRGPDALQVRVAPGRPGRVRLPARLRADRGRTPRTRRPPRPE